MQSWSEATTPIERVHLDHFFFGNKILLIIVDVFSNWIDIQEDFCEANNITHKTSPLYHPQSNGIVERSVGIAKNNLKKYLTEEVLN